MKKPQKTLLALALALLLTLGAGLTLVALRRPKAVPAPPAEGLTIWGWDYTIRDAFEEYRLSHPNIELNFVYVPANDYENRLKLALATGEALPDICILQSEIRRELLSLDIWENLEQAPYGMQREELLEYSIPTVEGPDGSLRAVPYDVSASGIAYRRSLARATIQTDDPIQVAVTFNSWADLLSKGAAIQAERPDFFLFASAEDAAVILYGQTNEPYIRQNAMVNPHRFYNYFQVLTALRDAKLVDKLAQWSPSWYNSFREENYLFYPCPLWLPQRGVFGDGDGAWGYAVPPSGSFDWGGTAWAIPKDGKNKTLAWDFTRAMLLSKAGAIYNKNKENGVFISYKPAYEMEGYKVLTYPDFGSQDIGQIYFDKLLPGVQARQAGEHDSVVQSAYRAAVARIVNEPTLTTGEVYAGFLQTIAQALPDVALGEKEAP
ncbi:MAG: extracellular solute-binding protein [Pseudoflavonifractor sp.]